VSRSTGVLNSLRERFLALPPDTPQPEIQDRLARIHAAGDLSAVMDCLFRWSLAAGYITREKLEQVERLEFPDPDTGVTFRIQVNHARTKYSDAQEREKKETAGTGPAPCLLCKDNIGRPGKESLRAYEFLLDGRERSFFLQLTPFPLYPYHFVPVLAEHSPQLINARSVEDMLDFLRLAPDYTVASNSDVEWAGASILSHLHYQVLRGVRLPVMDARPVPGLSRRLPGLSIEFLHYPLPAFRFMGVEEEPLKTAAAGLIALWKSLDPGRNTVNLNLARTSGSPPGLLFTVLLRNPDYRTPVHLRRFKSEGVGVIEASGEAILPVPKGPEAEALWREIRSGGLQLTRALIAGNAPPQDPERTEQLLEGAVCADRRGGRRGSRRAAPMCATAGSAGAATWPSSILIKARHTLIAAGRITAARGRWPPPGSRGPGHLARPGLAPRQ
jgi:UDPglucose--hexose-1-phosphate uridylyltransferase